MELRSGKSDVHVWKANAPSIPPGDWFTLEVIVEGNRIKTLVNGKTVLETKDETDMSRMGHFALHVERGFNPMEASAVRFRKIEIRELPAGK